MRISPERWRVIEPHFDAVAEMDEAERAAYLAGLEREDASLAADLRGLLSEGDDDRLRDLGASAPDLLSAAGAEPARPPDLAERMVGPYRVVRTIGRGGMSVVYLAERADGKFDQQVAVKVMHWTGGARAIDRFRLEQQTLARLDHPSLTRIFDAGVTDDGLPYFVMEWVDGEPVTRAAAAQNLGIREGVRLIVRLCGAVHSAHQRLVVHRDLKPDNVLMTRDGHLKVLDFGIAKWLTDEGDDEAPALTRHGEGLLTPQYASPEQFLDQPVTTATDVYALGLLLYELLAGHPPYELAGKSFTEQRRLVCDQAPQPLGARAEDPERRRELGGDLETICAKALQKEPARRYDSAAALADDLRRYLDGQPVQAAPDSAAYRASRFVRRHRVPVAIAALAVAGLAAAAITTAWQAGIAARERDLARIEAARSEKIVDFLIGSLDQANPYAENGGAVSVREFLERSADRIDTELADQPEVRERVYATMAQVLSHVGELGRGRTFGARAVHLADSLYGASSVESAIARNTLARIVAHTSHDSAMVLQREAVSALDSRRDRKARIALANVLEDYAVGLDATMKPDSALAVQRRALAIREDVYDGPHADLARSHHYIASALSAMNDPGAGAEFEEAARLWKETLGPDHPNYSSTLNNWAVWLERTGQPDSAAVIYEKALGITRRALGPRASGVASHLNNLGRLVLTRGRLDEAEGYLSEAIDILRDAEGADLPLAAATTNLGLAAFLKGDYETAEARYRSGRDLFARRFGADHAFVAIADSYVGRTLWMEGHLDEAESRLDRAIAVLDRHPASMGSRRVAALTWSGRLLMQRDPGRGEARLRKAVELADALPEHGAERGEAEVALGLALMRRGATEEGLMRLRAGYENLLAAHGESHPMTRWALESLESTGTAGRL